MMSLESVTVIVLLVIILSSVVGLWLIILSTI